MELTAMDVLRFAGMKVTVNVASLPNDGKPVVLRYYGATIESVELHGSLVKLNLYDFQVEVGEPDDQFFFSLGVDESRWVSKDNGTIELRSLIAVKDGRLSNVITFTLKTASVLPLELRDLIGLWCEVRIEHPIPGEMIQRSWYSGLVVSVSFDDPEVSLFLGDLELGSGKLPDDNTVRFLLTNVIWGFDGGNFISIRSKQIFDPNPANGRTNPMLTISFRNVVKR